MIIILPTYVIIFRALIVIHFKLETVHIDRVYFSVSIVITLVCACVYGIHKMPFERYLCASDRPDRHCIDKRLSSVCVQVLDIQHISIILIIHWIWIVLKWLHFCVSLLRHKRRKRKIIQIVDRSCNLKLNSNKFFVLIFSF